MPDLFFKNTDNQITKIIVRIIFIFFISFIIHPAINAKEPELSYLEKILERVSKESVIIPSYDKIEYLFYNPLYLLDADAEDLLVIPTISLPLAERIIEITRNNKKANLKNLIDSLKLNNDQIYFLRVLTTFKTKENPLSVKLRSRFYEQFQEAKGYESDKFAGDPAHLYNRLNIKYSALDAGLLVDKDGGEKSYADFVSGYAKVNLFNTQLIIGDYSIMSGLGSILWETYGFGKGSAVVSPAYQFGSGIVPYRSSLESRFLRGFALQNNSDLGKGFSVLSSLWYSSVKRSGNIDSTGTIITSLYTSSYYHTETEINKRNAVTENIGGALLQFQNKNFVLGASGFQINYDKTIQTNSKAVFSGKEGLLGSVFAIANFNQFYFSSEISRDAKNNYAYKANTVFEGKLFESALCFRLFPTEYRSPFGYNFGESVSPANETGLYWSLFYKGFEKHKLSLFLDYFNLPANGFKDAEAEFFFEDEWKPDSVNLLNLRLSFKSFFNRSAKRNDDYNSRIEFRRQLSGNMQLWTRAEITYVFKRKFEPDEIGYAFFADFKYSTDNTLTLGCRASYFDTDSFDSAIWQFESTIPGYFNTISLYMKGLRAYVYTMYQPLEQLQIWLRYSITYKFNDSKLGSGYLEILTNTESRFYIQVDFKI
ncbi:MAG: hypothetical protein WCT77_04580 [Bacteroidota bacterium]